MICRHHYRPPNRQHFGILSATTRQPCGNPSAALPRHPQAFGKPSGSDPESSACSASLRDDSGRFRRLNRNHSATVPLIHAEYMRNTCRAHAEWSFRKVLSRRIAEFRSGTLRQGFGVLLETRLKCHLCLQ